jgi:hypothetical protein
MTFAPDALGTMLPQRFRPVPTVVNTETTPLFNEHEEEGYKPRRRKSGRADADT